jgi:hypothetical protein
MSSVLRTSTAFVTEEDIALQMTQQKWKIVDIGISGTDLKTYFPFLMIQ